MSAFEEYLSSIKLDSFSVPIHQHTSGPNNSTIFACISQTEAIKLEILHYLNIKQKTLPTYLTLLATSSAGISKVQKILLIIKILA